MKAKFVFDELVKFADNLRDHPPQLEIETLILQYAKEFLLSAKKHTPVETGNLLKHWDIDNENIKVRKLKHGYSVTLYNKASKTTKEGKTYKYGSWVDEGHQSFNQFGGPYVVYNSKYGLNGGAVIGRFIVDNAVLDSQYKLRRTVRDKLQKWLDRCVNDAK